MGGDPGGPGEVPSSVPGPQAVPSRRRGSLRSSPGDDGKDLLSVILVVEELVDHVDPLVNLYNVYIYICI